MTVPPIPRFEERASKVKKLSPRLISLAKKHGSPIYIYDSKEAKHNTEDFLNFFKSAGKETSLYYALKSNPHIELLKTIVDNGGHLDVSSVRELSIALKAKPKKLIYTGPGKTEDDFYALLPHRKKTIVHLDSENEAKLFSKLAAKENITLNCGIRIFTSAQAAWSKFGIPINELSAAWNRIQKLKGINLQGIQFHISWNLDSSGYLSTIRELGRYLKKHFSSEMLSSIKFIDIGGGYMNDGFEAMYSWNPGQGINWIYPEGFLDKLLKDKIRPRFIPTKSAPLKVVATDIVKAFKSEILSLNNKIELFTEPGRAISHSVLHFLLKVSDIKPDRSAIIVDGGCHMVGWEKQQWVDYTPIFNLSSFSLTNEIPRIIYGSLCTANDIWGYYLYTKRLPEIGDTLIMPYQGAYTFTTAQNFIKPIPEIVTI